MAGMNQATLIGNVGGDPEIKDLASGGKVARFSIATSESWRDKASGERKERTEWHTIVVFNEALVDVVEKYVKKGSKLCVQGAIRTRKWQDRDGNDRYSTEIQLTGFDARMLLLDKKEGSGRAPIEDDERALRGDKKATAKKARADEGGGGFSDRPDFDDEIPF